MIYLHNTGTHFAILCDIVNGHYYKTKLDSIVTTTAEVIISNFDNFRATARRTTHFLDENHPLFSVCIF